jgi:Tol biopolymer transport system component/tRNA A-37 threonylcarbamoyl transferase component Bud32
MTLNIGTRLGPYEVTAPLGAGGMGEVYRATDTVLKRHVALKVLLPEVANDSERVARFQREAEVLASLNHPNIAHLYGLDRSNGTLALVMELVEGPTLADRIAKGPIPLDEALPIAKQIAEGLEAAHEQAIVHRDLKPANIKVRDDGTVKVLDFGLAKAMEPLAGNGRAAVLTNSPTITSPALMPFGYRSGQPEQDRGLTGVGMLLGTAAYMSPEQARGRPSDRRADIWAFGCVLFEMLTGTRAFAGDEVTDVLAAIVRGEPDWTALPPDTPVGIRRLLRRTLQKDSRQRLGDIRDARLELEELEAGSSTGTEDSATRVSAAPTAARGLWWITLIAAAIFGAVVAGAAMWWRRPISIPDDRIYRTEILPPGELAAAPALRLALSPDGRRLAMIALNDAGRQMLWVRALDQSAAQLVPGTEGASSPFWSPDSRFIAYMAEGKLKKVDPSGGMPITLADARTNPPGTWNRDDVILFTPGLDGPIVRIGASGGTAVPVTKLAEGERTHLFPHFLPDGDHFLYTVQNAAYIRGGIVLGSLSSGEVRQLVPDVASNAMYANGYLFFLRGTTLMAQPFDETTLSLVGDVVPVAEELITNPVANQSGGFSVSKAGSLAFQAEPMAGQLGWLDRSGKVMENLGEPQRYGDISLSADGSLAAFTILSPDGTSKVWSLDLARGTRMPLTPDIPEALMPVLAPAGDVLVYTQRDVVRKRSVLRQIKLLSLEDRELPIQGEQELLPLALSADNRLLMGQASSAIRGTLWQATLDGRNGGLTPYVKTTVSRYMAQLSPDGRWVAYVSNEAGRDEVYVSPFPEATQKLRVSASGGALPRWRHDGKELFFVSGTNATGGTLVRSALYSAAVTLRGSSLEFGTPVALFDVVPGGVRYFYDVSPDGQRFLVNSARARVPSVTLLVNWPASFRTR